MTPSVRSGAWCTGTWRGVVFSGGRQARACVSAGADGTRVCRARAIDPRSASATRAPRELPALARYRTPGQSANRRPVMRS